MRISGYWAGCDNFGDMLTKDIFESIVGESVYPDNTYYAKVCGAGSILNCFVDNIPREINNYPLYVFGTGFDNFVADYEGQFIRKLKPYAVRGEFTKHYIEQVTGKEYSDVVLGDIGLLVRHLIPDKPILKKYDLGIVPHYVDENDIRFMRLAERCSCSKILSVHNNPRIFIEELLECRYVISTAMHPLIACDALRIPNIWAFLPDANQVDMSVKFNDYYSAFGLRKKALVLSEEILQENIIDLIKATYDITEEMVEKKIDELENAFMRMRNDMHKDFMLDTFWSSVSKISQLGGVFKNLIIR